MGNGKTRFYKNSDKCITLSLRAIHIATIWEYGTHLSHVQTCTFRIVHSGADKGHFDMDTCTFSSRQNVFLYIDVKKGTDSLKSVW